MPQNLIQSICTRHFKQRRATDIAVIVANREKQSHRAICRMVLIATFTLTMFLSFAFFTGNLHF